MVNAANKRYPFFALPVVFFSIVQLYRKRAVGDGEWFCTLAGKIVKERDSRF